MLENQKINVLVIHDEPIICIALSMLFSRHSEFSVSCVGDREKAIHNIDSSRQEVVIIADYHTGMSMLANQREAIGLANSRLARVVILTRQSREREISSAMRSGALGYLLMTCASDELVHGIRVASGGEPYLCRTVAEVVKGTENKGRLTNRETEILRQMAIGLGNKTIARKLGIQPETVKSHVKRIFVKMKVNSRAHAVAVGLDLELLPEESGEIIFAESAAKRDSSRPSRHPELNRLSAVAVAT